MHLWYCHKQENVECTLFMSEKYRLKNVEITRRLERNSKIYWKDNEAKKKKQKDCGNKGKKELKKNGIYNFHFLIEEMPS